MSTLVMLPTTEMIESLQFWRLITTPFADPFLINALLMGLLYTYYVYVREYQIGTARSVWHFFWANLIIAGINMGLQFLLPFTQPYYGLLPLICCEMCIDCLLRPNLARDICCLPT